MKSLVFTLAVSVCAVTFPRSVNVWYPDETVELALDASKVAADGNYEIVVSDWLDQNVLTRAYDASSSGKVAFAEADLVGRFGAFRADVREPGTTNVVARSWFARLTSREVSPCPWIGTCAHTQRHACYADGRYLELLSAAGVGVLREDCEWQATERTKGVYRTPPRYEALFDALDRRGIALSFLMTWENRAYENPLDPDGFAAFCAYTANRFKGRAKRYEIWNEPQNTPFRTVYPKDARDANSNLVWVVKFAELCRKASAAIHAVDPHASVAVTGEDVDWLLYDMIRLGCAGRDDLVAFHPYCHFQPRPERAYWFDDGGAKMRALAAQHGGASRFCITEAGWTTFEGKMKFLEIAGCYPRVNLEQQARYIARMYILARLTGIEYACQYGWMDEGTDPAFTEHHFGQVFNNGEPKPAFAATAFLARLLGTADVVGERSPDPARFRVAAFRRNGRDLWAVWAVEGACTFELPASFGPVAACYDLMGNRCPPPFTTGRTLALTERPLFLEADSNVRTVELVDFGTHPGRAFRGGECPNAKASLAFAETNGATTAVVDFDLAQGEYVGYTLGTSVPSGTTKLLFDLCALGGTDLPMGFRCRDSRGQVFQYPLDGSVSGDGTWHRCGVDLSKWNNTWMETKEPKGNSPAFPIVRLDLFCSSGAGRRVASFSLKRIAAETTATREALPDHVLSFRPARFGAYWYPNERPAFKVGLTPRAEGARAEPVRWSLSDWKGDSLGSGTVAPGANLEFAPEFLGNRFGSFRLSLEGDSFGRKLRRDCWFARLTDVNPKPCGWVGSIGGGAKALDLYAAAGIGVVNCSTEWRFCERRRGEYDHRGYGAGLECYVTNILARGIKPHLMIQGENPIYADSIDHSAFAEWAADFARHYAALGVDGIEIWNEPQNFVFRKHYGDGDDWNVWVDQYVKFTRKVRNAIRKAAPHVTVSVCAEDIEWLLYDMVSRGIAQKGDAISFHPYCHRQIRPEHEYFFRDQGEALRKLALMHGGATRFRISEAGWTTFLGEGEYWEVAGCYPRSTLEQQARYMVRMYLLARQSGCDYACQYRFDDGSRREYTEHNFGFVFEDYTPKPAFAAVAFMTRLLGEAQPSGERSKDLSRFRVSTFRQGRRILYAVWSVQEETRWTLPDSLGDAVDCFDLMGNRIPVPIVQDRVLRLTEDPVYLVGASEP